MKLSELTSTLREIRVVPVRSLGQNFLHDQNLARAIVDAAGVEETDYVVEIGPGLGALTTFILEKGAAVLAIEKDARLAQYLRDECKGNDRLEIRHMDALRFDVRELFGRRKVKLLANLPYYVASQILLRFLEYPSPISLALLMLQKEMAQRISARPATASYGALSVRLQHDYKIELLRSVPPTVFIPQPEVDSAIIRITPRPDDEPRAIDRENFYRVIRSGFAQRRKQLRKLLEIPEPKWLGMADRVGLSINARAEELSLEDWVNLSNEISRSEGAEPPDTANEMFPVVDSLDRLLRSAPRTEVHANNLLHRAVHIFIFNRAGELLLQKRSRYKDRHPLQWDSSAAGHLDAAEDYASAAHRELGEELGIEAELTEVGKLPPSHLTGHEFIKIYTGKHDGAFHIPMGEVEWAGFFPVELIDKWLVARPEDFASGFVECWRVWIESRT